VTHIVFHIEGGVSNSQSGDMRQALRHFFSELDRLAKSQGDKVDFLMHGSRLSAYKGFCAALKNEPEKFHVLLVDSEDPVAHWGECWRHLRERQADNWSRPAGVKEAQCHLMVQAVEAWFFADPKAVEGYYKQGFQASILAVRQNVEEIPKGEHIAKLEAATRHSQKGLYHKTNHLPALLGKIDAAKVRARAWHCDQTFVTLSEKLGTNLTPLCALPLEP